MLTVADGLSSYTLGAGEPFLLQIAFRNADDTPADIGSRAFALSFFKANRALVAQILGEEDTDSTGDFLRFEEDGTFSETLFGQSLRVELAERYRNGRNVLASGGLTVNPTALTVPSLDNALDGQFAVRVVIKASATLGDDPTFILSHVPWAPAAPIVAPTPATTRANSSTVRANADGFAAPLLALQQRLAAIGA